MRASIPCVAIALNISVSACTDAQSLPHAPTGSKIERVDPALDTIVSPRARIEQIADGFAWSEGPIWNKRGAYLLFSDVPNNTIHLWKEGQPLGVYLRPSGYVGTTPFGRELGSNGLTFDKQDALVMADQGNRQISRVDPAKFNKTVLADRFEGKRFNSPNDLVYRSNGDLYFTDPPYGLTGLNADKTKELAFNGVYRLSAKGELSLLTKDLTFPNGIAFSPDEKTLYISNSDGEHAVWMAYDVQPDGSIANGRVLFDATQFVKDGKKGVPDGMKIDVAGNLFAAGPGGILIISPQGKHLGTIVTGQPTSNCTFGDDGYTLYITANNLVLRVRLMTKGVGF
jgi:gluconolactonase